VWILERVERLHGADALTLQNLSEWFELCSLVEVEFLADGRLFIHANDGSTEVPKETAIKLARMILEKNNAISDTSKT
jgi:hypothetical protein